jgi:ubiquinone/menaquinone biosynthesis C-methylase UbiE
MAFDQDVVKRYYDQDPEAADRVAYVPHPGNYAPNHYRRELVATLLEGSRRRVLDVGCGPGAVALTLIEQGHEVWGCDLSDRSIEVLHERLASRGRRDLRDHFRRGRAEDLSSYDDGAFDAVLALAVYTHLSDELESRALAEARRVLRPGGLLIAAYANRLFDFFTLNRYTVETFRDDVLAVSVPVEARARVLAAYGRLLERPDAPARPAPDLSKPLITQRDIFEKYHNPLVVPDALRRAGFEFVEHLFYRFHAFPPLLAAEEPELFEAASRAMEIRFARDWRGYLMASTFITVARKTAATERS